MKQRERNASISTKSTKQRLGACLIPRLPINRHIFNHLRTEINAMWIRLQLVFNPHYRRTVSRLKLLKNIKINVGSGPFGEPDWVNLDLFSHKSVTLRADCRYGLPFADGSCRGIHVEHFFEHLNHSDERHTFLDECYRCLAPGGVLRIIVPDAELFVAAYVSPGWESFRAIAAAGDDPERQFPTKMDALNHMFIQDFEHYGGYDEISLTAVLQAHEFRRIRRQSFRVGSFPDGCIDREQHQPYSLYMEAEK